MIDYHKLLNHITHWAFETGRIQLENFRKNDLLIDKKSTTTDLVTEVDKKSEEYIISQIKKEYPDHSILAEESGEESHSSDYTWIIDPLDGTNNYANGLPIFCVSIALQYKKKTIVGAVFAPYLDELFYAIRGKGVFLNGEKIKIGEKTSLNDSIIATGFPYDKKTNPIDNLIYFNKVVKELRGIRRFGAAAYDLSLVACGVLDGFWELDLKIWDIAAATLFVEEAGGSIKPLRSDRNFSIIAGNKVIVEELEKKLNS